VDAGELTDAGGRNHSLSRPLAPARIRPFALHET
jgi:hypothetical protein